LVVEKEPCLPNQKDVSWVLVEKSREALNKIASPFFGNPSRKMRIFGVTGTNGKTTTCFFLRNILETSGTPSGLLTTCLNAIGPLELEPLNTTEESINIQNHLHTMLRMGIQNAVIEVSSHGLALGRLQGVSFDYAVITNLIPEHMEFHLDFEDYFQSKRKLFRTLEENLDKSYPRMALFNADDPHCRKMLEALGIARLGFGLKEKADISAEKIEYSLYQTSFIMNTPWGKTKITINFPGEHNVYNALAAAGMALTAGVSLEKVKEGLENTRKIPGRWEKVENKRGIEVIVDFAHNWHGLQKALSLIRKSVKGNLITVFGCGGERDRAKRPLMGKVVAQYSDVCIISTDNPRNEDPMQTIYDALEGVKEVAKQKEIRYHVIPDRKEAIQKALKEAKKGDAVFLTGKGPERFQIIANQNYPHNDYQVAKELLEEDED
ncbi:MAG: UDP-N-acetylmuramoyl-L-alanyl-D-glutamate--2,6-diaminopimelate ligase, partial [Candidatus Atribacteria bacterium]|nr:UDP-N-acetylmuramoyl-L-alanyl-D-glutamate--2,6-diaminopimelate ligase [Candidatus Atribacteria bacterium]MCD6349690.1 UDP-N-acetylmuramoyl-L-alanyl-D-glutamate--2,6-diaminopimelate ligase [Candidatus Atribacteria bacterium]